MAMAAKPTYIVRNSGKTKAGSGGKRGKKHTDRVFLRALARRWIRGVFLSSACELFGRVFLLRACEPLDQGRVSFTGL